MKKVFDHFYKVCRSFIAGCVTKIAKMLTKNPLSKQDIITALTSSEFWFLYDHELRASFKKYVIFRQGTSHFKFAALEMIECYELCKEIMDGKANLENLENLEELCFTERWEDQLKTAIKNNTLYEFCLTLQTECGRRIGEQTEYEFFRDELRKQLKNYGYF